MNETDAALNLATEVAAEIRVAIATHITDLIRQYHLTRGRYSTPDHYMVTAIEQSIRNSLVGYMGMAGPDFDHVGWFDQYNDKDRRLLLRIWSGA